MSDLISRQDAIEAIMGLPTWWADDGGYYGGAQPPMEALLDPKDVVSAIENLPSAEPERKWIPVTEALPKNYEQTICIDSRGKMMIGMYGEYGWTFPCYMTEPVAWMPLPEAWRGE